MNSVVDVMASCRVRPVGLADSVLLSEIYDFKGYYEEVSDVYRVSKNFGNFS